jgi:hypothetical protein
MTKPKSVEPPRLATWLLERFSSESEPLAGDLIESFKHGCSSGWYWRQVLMAILIALPQLMRKHLVLFAYTVACSAVVSIAWFCMFPNVAHASAFPRVFALYARSYGIEWPWSFVYQVAFITTFQAATVWAALIAYLTFSRQLRGRNLLRVLLGVLVVLAISNLALPLVSGFLGSFYWFGWVVVSAPPAIAFIVGNWKVRRSGSGVMSVVGSGTE